MRFKKNAKTGRMISYGNVTQEEISNYLRDNHGISKGRFTAFVKQARDNDYIWDNIETDEHIITVYVVPRHMWLGIAKR